MRQLKNGKAAILLRTKKRALIYCVTFLATMGQLPTNAQSFGVALTGSALDFSGIYGSSSSINSSVISVPDVYPLTTAGERAYNSYDHVEADRQNIDDCAVEAVPAILWQRLPVRFSQEDGNVTMHFERDDAVRTIHMDDSPPLEH
jgi:hypothetical protein